MQYKNKVFSSIAALGVGAILSLAPLTASAVDYPERPVTMVVGFAPGGATDTIARLIGKSLSEELGQPVVIENRPGAAGNIAGDYVARSKNDGYTLYVGAMANLISRALFRKDIKYDYLKDLEFVGLMSLIPNALVVNPDLPYKTVQEYLDYAKANPGKLTCASAGTGSSIHMSCELFKVRTGTDILHIPYRGSSPAVLDLLGGQVDSMFDNLPTVLPHIQSGALRVLATTTDQRVPSLPDVPTFKEEGVQDFVVVTWLGLNAPLGTPEPIIKTLNTALNNVLKEPAIIEMYKKNAYLMPVSPNSPETFRAVATAAGDLWDEVVKKAKIEVN